MVPRTFAAARRQTLGEEVANALSHGLALALALASLPILVWQAARHGGAADVVGASIFAGSGVVLYLVSTLYHALPWGRAKAWLGRLDHALIYVFIAGTYTPFTLGVLGGAWGWSLFGIVWALAALGVALKLANRLQQPWVSTLLYVAMGWVAVVAAGPILERVPVAGIGWLVAGGLSYTLGAAFFLLDSRVRYAHAVWHLFVLGGSVCHFFAAYGYARAA